MPDTQQQLDQLTRISASALKSIQALQHVAEAHTEQIDKLIDLAEAHHHDIDALKDTVASLVREWQAYLRMRPKQ
jgi:cell division septum initiation protein DivIVA